MHRCDHTDSESHHTVGESKSVPHRHYAHKPRLGHIRLSEEVRLNIAGKLVQGAANL